MKREIVFHPAIRLYRAGRGYGVMLAPEVDYGLIGNGTAAHVLNEGLAICGKRGDVARRIDGADPRAEVVERAPVCVTCREKLGEIPEVVFAKDVEGDEAAA